MPQVCKRFLSISEQQTNLVEQKYDQVDSDADEQSYENNDPPSEEVNLVSKIRELSIRENKISVGITSGKRRRALTAEAVEDLREKLKDRIRESFKQFRTEMEAHVKTAFEATATKLTRELSCDRILACVASTRNASRRGRGLGVRRLRLKPLIRPALNVENSGVSCNLVPYLEK